MKNFRTIIIFNLNMLKKHNSSYKLVIKKIVSKNSIKIKNQQYIEKNSVKIKKFN